jgi:RimJ/RimL family protein N-acetyltransferase
VNGFELQPHLVGNLVELRPLKPEDWSALFEVASDPLIWVQHPDSERYREDVFREFFQGALDSGGAFVALDRETQKIIGSSRYWRYAPERSEIEIGFTFLARSYWGGKYNGEMKHLMLDHALKFVNTVVLVVGTGNIRSRKAVERIGGVLTDRREVVNFRGRLIDHVVYEVKKPGLL